MTSRRLQFELYLKSYIFWDIELCNLVKISRHFRGTVSLLGLLFDPTDESNVFLRNVG